MKENKINSKICLLVCYLVLLGGCNQSFEPLQDNDEFVFSIYGYLDAAADTQWIRIGVLRESINETPDPTRMTVTLEHVESGQTVVMQDSLFIPGNLLNYWATMPIENEQTYRIKAEREGRKSSVVTVTIPGEMPTPLVIENRNFPPYGSFIYIDDSVEHLADIQTKWYVILNPMSERIKKMYTFSYRNSIKHTEVRGGAYTAFADIDEERQYITRNANAEFEVLYRQFFVASAGPEWDASISSINDIEYFLNATASNVENGLGYVVGIDSKWIPYDSCFTSGRTNVIPCEPEKPYW